MAFQTRNFLAVACLAAKLAMRTLAPNLFEVRSSQYVTQSTPHLGILVTHNAGSLKRLPLYRPSIQRRPGHFHARMTRLAPTHRCSRSPRSSS